MCGIAGLLKAGGGLDWLAETATAMAAALRHRGPDDSGVWTDAAAGVAFAHRRLSVIDLSPLGAQPMVSASGHYVIAFNGEVYNFRELRLELEASGAAFRGASDTEVVLAAIDAWGVDGALPRFIGMFAFALWDREARSLTLVRDRLGIKPLYWGRFGDLFVFGSELKALAACPGWTPEVDRDALVAYVRWNYVPSPQAIYRGVAKLEPGSVLTVRLGEEPRLRRFWDLRSIASEGSRAPLDAGDDEAEDELESLLRNAVQRRMVADVPVGAFLSGGTDSSLVVALMQAQQARPVHTFTIGFPDDNYNEAVHAMAVARHLGTHHTELYVEPRDAMDVIPDLPLVYDEPFADSSQLPTLLVSRMARRAVTVALSGDGGDELFAGYTRYHWAELVRRRFLGLPRPARRALAAAIDLPPGSFWEAAALLLPRGRRPLRVGERASKLAAFLREPNADAMYRRQHTHWDEPGGLVRGGTERYGLLYDQALRTEFPDFVTRMQFLDAVTYLPDDILTKVDRASMAVGLEARVPLLDHRVVEFAWRLPKHMKLRGGETKWLLRRILSRHVPPYLFERPKMGFSLPLAAWLRGPLRDWAETLLDERRLRDAGYFEETRIRAAWNGFLAGRTAAQEPLWGILMFEAWHDAALAVPAVPAP